MGAERLPNRVYVTNETGQPSASDIFDADTGAHVDGVFEVHVARGEITVEASISWPTGKDDLARYDPTYTGPQKQGVKTVTRTYHVKRLELESW